MAVSFGSTVTFGNDDEILLEIVNSYHLNIVLQVAISTAGGNPIDIKGTAIRLKSNSDENIIIGTTNDSVSLYYDNAKKLETTNTGATVTGTLAATATGDGSGLTSLTGASAGTYGASNITPVITVDSNGRITGIATVDTAGGGGGGGGISNLSEDTTPTRWKLRSE